MLARVFLMMALLTAQGCGETDPTSWGPYVGRLWTEGDAYKLRCARVERCIRAIDRHIVPAEEKLLPCTKAWEAFEEGRRKLRAAPKGELEAHEAWLPTIRANCEQHLKSAIAVLAGAFEPWRYYKSSN